MLLIGLLTCADMNGFVSGVKTKLHARTLKLGGQGDWNGDLEQLLQRLLFEEEPGRSISQQHPPAAPRSRSGPEWRCLPSAKTKHETRYPTLLGVLYKSEVVLILFLFAFRSISNLSIGILSIGSVDQNSSSNASCHRVIEGFDPSPRDGETRVGETARPHRRGSRDAAHGDGAAISEEQLLQ